MTPAPAIARKPRFSKQDFYRYCRLVHGWLSACAFLVLLLFSITGLLLNHPDWSIAKAPPPIETKFTLTEADLARILNAEAPEHELVSIAAGHAPLRGELTDGNEVGHEIFVRMQGVRGLTDLRANLVTGAVSVIIEPAPAIAVLNELHRGERAGNGWRLIIDAIAILLIAMSLAGYLIFLSLKFRLRTALVLTVASSLGLWLVFVAAVA